MICKNCGNNFEGKFCNNCGQKANTYHLTLSHAASKSIRTFTHVDSGIFFLIKEMFLRPGITAKEYIEGKRKKYFNPVQYLILAVAVATFLSVKFNLIGPNTDITPDTMSNLNEIQRISYQHSQFIYKYFNLILFIAVPVMAFFTRLFYGSYGYNYAEILVMNIFLAAQRTLIFILLAPFLYFFKSIWYIFIGIFYIAWIIYFGWAYVQFFNQKRFTVILKYIILVLVFIPAFQLVSWGIFYLFFYHK